MRVLILGKTGQVGWELQRALAPLGEVVALGRDEADLEDAAKLSAAVVNASPDVIVNAAAYTAVDKAESEVARADRINHRAVGELGEIAAQRGAWVIQYSTDYVFNGDRPGAYAETEATDPQGVYGRSKRDGETALAASGAPHLILRTSWVHAGRGQNFVRTMLRLAAERPQLRVVADQIGAPTSAALIAEVTADAVARIGRGAPIEGGIYHLTAAGETSWHGLAQEAIAEAERLGAPLMAHAGDVVAITTADYPTPAKRPVNSRLDTRKLRAALGTSLPDWQSGVRQTVAQLLERPTA